MNRIGQLDWLLDDLVARVEQIEKAVILSRDGLAIGSSAGLSREDSEHLSAVAAGFQSLARGVGQQFGCGLPRQTIVEMESAFLFVTAAGEGSCLAVLAAADAEAAGQIAYEMAVLVRRVGEHMAVGPRPPASAAEAV
jgi:predicted regulator of Ras-like GTPase activity (Roadblock/LC7/MglB family)